MSSAPRSRGVSCRRGVLKRLYQARGWSQAEFVEVLWRQHQADKTVGTVSKSTLNRAERGLSIDLRTLAALAMALGVSLRNISDEIAPGNKLDRDVTGAWSGHGHELEFPKRSARFTIELEITADDRKTIHVECVVKAKDEEKPLGFKMDGELYGDIIMVEYRSVDRKDKRFGTMMLELNGLGNELRGWTLGYSGRLNRLTVADVIVKRAKLS